MPIYEYRCRGCGKKSSVFIRTIGAASDPQCSHCQSHDLERTLSSFACHRSLKTLHREPGAPPGPRVPSLDYYRDPRNVGRYVEQSFEKYGVEMPQSVRDGIDAARGGQVPEGLDL
jgi:putative FmdB family regulatory protein